MRRPPFKPWMSRSRLGRSRQDAPPPKRHGFEYYRHGNALLYAALKTATGRVHGKTAARLYQPEFLQQHPRVQFTSRPLTHPGSTKSRSGSPRSNARSSRAASSPRFPTWLANSDATSTHTLPNARPIRWKYSDPPAASAVTNSLRQATRSEQTSLRQRREVRELQRVRGDPETASNKTPPQRFPESYLLSSGVRL